MTRTARLAALAGAGALSACSPRTLAVRSYPQPEFAAEQIVPLEPPPAQIEYLPAQPPAPSCRWVDGQWVWRAQHWSWEPGTWVYPPGGCRYSAPSPHWALAQGRPTLYYRPGRWYSVTQPAACPEPASCAEAGAPAPAPRDTTSPAPSARP